MSEKQKNKTPNKNASKIQKTQWIIEEGGETHNVAMESSSTYFFSKTHAAKAFSGEDFTYKDVEPMIDFFDFNQRESAEFLEVDPATITRWKKNPKTIGRLRSKNLLEIDEIISKGIRIFGNEEALKDWLNTTNYALGDVAPIELLKDPYGVALVEEAIEGLSWGSFV